MKVMIRHISNYFKGKYTNTIIMQYLLASMDWKIEEKSSEIVKANKIRRNNLTYD